MTVLSKHSANVFIRQFSCLAIVAIALLLDAGEAHAYIGPGAGFAFLGSTFVLFLTIAMALFTILAWPLQFVWRKVRGFGISRKARSRRVVIVGLDGLDPGLAEQYMAAGRMPNLKALGEEGSYRRLGTTVPSLSPVAWSTFQTGVNPGAHNIFDFLTRDKRCCLPLLSSTSTGMPRARFKIGTKEFFFKKPEIRLLRGSQPFWKILGKRGIFSNIIRVPISYPPEKFHGNILSAMCTPDLRGSQGTFSYFTNRPGKHAAEGGEFRELSVQGASASAALEGPPDPSSKEGVRLKLPFTLDLDISKSEALLKIGSEEHLLKLGVFSEWVHVPFKAGRSEITGICRFCLREIGPNVALYVSPINVDPERPALPISEPVFFSTYLAKKQGPFGTLGLLEDTWARNEYALDDQRFLDQTYLTHQERERMFLDVLDRTREGICICVFDASDRIQHMFWRYIDEKHPSPREENPAFGRVIPEMYERMDALIGKVRGKLKKSDILMVISDHGFSSFRRGINLNTWLMQQGYLAVKDGGVTGADYFGDVDWSRTKAFAVGLSGLYINRKGRERLGIVGKEEAESLKKEIGEKLEKLLDPADGSRSIRRVYDTAKTYKGIYTADAPDLVMGYEPGYRVSWDSVTGKIEPAIFSDNIKAWSGDHHVDPEAVPGIFFCSEKVKSDTPHIMDIAPTVLDIFAVPVPGYMEGKVIV